MPARRDGTPADIRSDVLHGESCAYCGSRSYGIVEHIVPVVRGGSSARSNLTRSCWTCNAEKSTDTPAEWRARRLAEGKAWPPRNVDDVARAWAELCAADEAAVLLAAVEAQDERLGSFMLEVRRRYRAEDERPFERDLAEALRIAGECGRRTSVK